MTVQTRRDELAEELAGQYYYMFCLPSMRRAIDRIIQLEGEADARN